MKYEKLREIAQTGDILFLAGNSLMSKFLRAATASQYSHISVLVWIDRTLWVSEVKPGTGYTLTPASKRIAKMMESGNVWYAKTPDGLDRSKMHKEIMQYRDGAEDKKQDPNYSYATGLLLWVSQLIRRPLPTKLVCSTYVATVWAAGGFDFILPPDPEDFTDHVNVLHKIDSRGIHVHNTEAAA